MRDLLTSLRLRQAYYEERLHEVECLLADFSARKASGERNRMVRFLEAERDKCGVLIREFQFLIGVGLGAGPESRNLQQHRGEAHTA